MTIKDIKKLLKDNNLTSIFVPDTTEVAVINKESGERAFSLKGDELSIDKNCDQTYQILLKKINSYNSQSDAIL